MTTKTKKSGKRKQAKATAKSVEVHGIRIRERRPGQYVIHIRRQGLNHFETFKSLDAAIQKAEQLHQHQVQEGLSAFDIDRDLRRDAKQAAEMLAGRCSLTDAAEHWLRHHPAHGSITINELVAEYLDALKRQQARPATMADAKVRLNRFAVDYGTDPATAITATMIEQWLDNRSGTGRNRNNHRRRLSAMFTYAASKYAGFDRNPAQQVKPARIDQSEVTIWQPERVAGILAAAQRFNPEMVPLLAVSAFCGLRPDEAAALDWQQVNLKSRRIRVLAGTSKTRKTRVVTISDNAVAWLAPHRQPTGNLAPSRVTIIRWRRKLSAAAIIGIDSVEKRLKKQTGLKGTEIKKRRLGWDDIEADAKAKAGALWPPDVLRHTYASAWLATRHNIYELAREMGNSPDIIKSHYDGVMDSDHAADYWRITPTGKDGKVIQISKTASA